MSINHNLRLLQFNKLEASLCIRELDLIKTTTLERK